MVGLSLGLGLGLSRRMGGTIGPTLSNLVLSASTVAESAASGTTIGTVIGLTKDSTPELTGDAGGLLVLDGATLKTAGALDYETAATLDWEITETLVGATNTPRVSEGTITVTDAEEANEAETDALLARMTATPDATRIGHINDLIAALKTGGVWAKLDALYVFATEDEADVSLNWIENAYNGDWGLSLSGFTADRGVQFTGTQVMDSTFNPSTAVSPNYVQDSAHIGCWSGTASASGVSSEDDIGTTPGNDIGLACRTSVNRIQYRVNQASSAIVASQTNGSGHVVIVRDGASSLRPYRNGSALTTSSTASTAVPNLTILVGDSGAASSVRMIRAIHFGSALSAGEVAAAHTAFGTYLTALGATP